MSLIRWIRVRPWLVRFLQALAIGVPLTVLLQSLIINWRGLRSYEWQINGVTTGLALLCVTAAFCLLPLASQLALSGLGYSVDYRTAYHGYFLSQLAKYIPGKLWILPGRALALRPSGVSMISSSLGIIVELSVLIVSGVVAFLPYLLLTSNEVLDPSWSLGVGLLVASILLALHPRIFNPVLRWLMVRLGHASVDVNLTGIKLTQMLLICLVFWLAAGLGLALLARSVQEMPFRLWILIPSAFSMAWVLGFLAFFTPGGLGVREGALALLLAPFLPAPLPAALALLGRLLWTVAELISVAIAALLRKQRHKDHGNVDHQP